MKFGATTCPECGLTVPLNATHTEADCDALKAGKPLPHRVEKVPSWTDEAETKRKANGAHK